jgi:hypothetical protein
MPNSSWEWNVNARNFSSAAITHLFINQHKLAWIFCNYNKNKLHIWSKNLIVYIISIYMYISGKYNYSLREGKCAYHTRKSCKNLQQTCSNAVPTTCQQDVFALLVPSSLTTCYKAVEHNRLVTSCSNTFLSSWNSTICQQVASGNLCSNLIK